MNVASAANCGFPPPRTNLRRAGSHQELEVRPVPSLATGLPSGPTNRALAWPHGWSRTVTSSPACLPESSTAAPHSMIGVEEVDRRGLLRVEPVQLEAAVADVE